MKRVLPWLLILALTLTGCGLAQFAEEEETPLRLYYSYAGAELGPYDGETGALGWETDALVSADASVERVLERYWEGPRTETLAMPIPAEVTVEDWTLEESCLTLTLSEAAASLFGMERTLAVACLVETLLQLPAVESVVLTAGQEEAAGSLFDTPLTAENFLLAS